MTEKKSAKTEPKSNEELTEQGPALEMDLTAIKGKLEAAERERDEYKEQLLRTMADFQNFRKRMQDEQRQIRTLANERLIVELLPVLDNFERAIQGMEQAAVSDSLLDGVRAIDRQFRSILEGQKVQRVQSVGQPFDPEHHDALALVESTEHEEGTVLEEIESGYKIGDKVIRPARVRVSKKP